MSDLGWVDRLTVDEATALRTELSILRDRRVMAGDLAAFVRGAWPVVEPGRALVWNWHLDVLCAYLEAVAAGKIRRLIVNIPPGAMKSLVVSVFYPAWRWISDPAHRFLCGSNEGTLATRDAMRMRALVKSEWFADRWGKTVVLAADQGEKTLFQTTARGHRESQGMLAKVTGKRGDTLLLDDPHDAKQSNSDVIRQAVLDAWDTAWTSRLNDPNSSAVILIMQRVHMRDLTGHLLAKEAQEWVHLVIPMRYDPAVTFDAGKDIGRSDLADPRTEPGELLFAERFSEATVQQLEHDLGPYGTSGQLQQQPSPKGGGEMRAEWLMRYMAQPVGGNRYVLVDPAGERKPGVKGKRDNTAMGVIEVCADGNLYLIDGYRDRLNLVERTDILFAWHRRYKPLQVGYESYGMQSDAAHIRDRMEREGYRFKLTELGGGMRKEDRIRRLIPYLEAGRLWLPQTLHRTLKSGQTVDLIEQFIEVEYLPFPVGQWDDFLDMLSRIADPDIKLATPQVKRPLTLHEHTPRDRAVGY